MPADERALVQGTLDMLTLKTLALEPMHGYGIGVRLTQISRGVCYVNAGSLFPALGDGKGEELRPHNADVEDTCRRVGRRPGSR